MHEFVRRPPFDLYELSLLRLVAKYRSFTKAAEVAGITQSAITRQIQGIEDGLGVQLFERTTRTVKITDAGQFLCKEAARLLGTVEQSLQQFGEHFSNARKEVRVVVSRTVSLSYLPGFFHANMRELPDLKYRISCKSSNDILSAIESNEQDLGVLCPPLRLPKTIHVTHRFADAFTLIAPASFEDVPIRGRVKHTNSQQWLRKQNWLTIDQNSNTGQRLRDWMHGQDLQVEPTMQLDNFDLIISLVSLGMGVSLVPIRALALYNQRHKIVRIPTAARFTRDLVVAVRKHRKLPAHIEQFVANVLFK